MFSRDSVMCTQSGPPTGWTLGEKQRGATKHSMPKYIVMRYGREGGFSHEENHMCIAPQPTMLDVVNLQRIAVSSSRHRSHRIVPGKAGGIPPMHSTSKVATTLSPASDFASECSVIPMLVVTRYCTPPSREDYSLHSGGTHGCMYG